MASESNTSSNFSVLLLLALNLLATLAVLGHVVFHIPENPAVADSDSAAVASSAPAELFVDGLGDIGMGAKGVELKMIKRNANNPSAAPTVVQTVSMSQEAFLNTLQRMKLLRDRLEEKELIRAVE